MLFVDRVVVGGLADRLDAAALVDGDVDDDRPRPHRLDELFADHDRGPPTGDEHRADHEVGVGDAALDRPTVRRQRHDPAAVDLVDPAQSVEVLVDQDDLGLHAGRDPRGVPPDVARPQHDDLRRAHARRPAHQHAAAAVVPLQEVGALLRRQPPGDLAHRGQQRQGPGLQLHRLVGQRRGAGGDERLGDVGVGGEVEVGEQREVVAQERELLLLGLLDLDDHLLRPGIGRCRDDLRAGRDVGGVADRGTLSGPGLDAHGDAVALQLADTVGRHRHAMLRRLDLLRHTDGPDRCRHDPIVRGATDLNAPTS